MCSQSFQKLSDPFFARRAGGVSLPLSRWLAFVLSPCYPWENAPGGRGQSGARSALTPWATVGLTPEIRSMPELPDIVVYLERLRPRIEGQPLERVRLASPFLLRSVEPPVTEAEGRQVRGLRRLGKRVVLELEAD